MDSRYHLGFERKIGRSMESQCKFESFLLSFQMLLQSQKNESFPPARIIKKEYRKRHANPPFPRYVMV